MKKNLILFAAALFAFAQTASGAITYELNGGKFNPGGYNTEEELYQGLAADVYASQQDETCAGFAFASTFKGEFGAPDVTGSTGPAFDIQTFDLTFFTGENAYAAKWKWLGEYLDATATAVGEPEAVKNPTTNSSYMRYALAAFFSNSVRPNWPRSADYAKQGVSSQKYWGTWGYSLGNKTEAEVGEEIGLMSPYKADNKFAGWYESASFEGDPVISVVYSADDKSLFAKWDAVEGDKITYVLHEGVTNDYGWKNGAELYQALAADIYASQQDETCAGFAFASTFKGEFGAPDVTGSTGPAFDIQTFDLTFFTGESTYAAKWKWLGAYLDATATAVGKPEEVKNPTTNSSYMRYALAAFFSNSVRPNWPASANYTNQGISTPKAYMGTWKHGYCNEANPTEEIVLAEPYCDTLTFDGWYNNAAFAGVKYTKVNADMVCTLHAHFIEYIPTCAEVAALKDSVTTKAQGKVTFVSGKQIYVIDETGGLLFYASQTPSVKAGDQILVEGMKINYHGAPEISKAEILTVEAGKVAPVTTITIPEVKADPMKYFAQPLAIKAVRIAAYDKKGNMIVKDGLDSVLCYGMTPDQAVFAVGVRVNLKEVVADYYDGLQFKGNTSEIELIPSEAKEDPAEYATVVLDTISNKSIDIKSNWAYTVNLGNWENNKPNAVAEQSRGMAVAGGKVYVNWRSSNTPDPGTMKLNVYSAANGEKLDDIILKNYVFQQPEADTTDTRVVTDPETGITYLAEGYEWNYDEFNQGVIFGPCTDMEVDEKGHILIASLPTEGHVFQIWKVDPATGEGEVIIYMGGNSGISDLAYRFETSGTIRLDRIAVYGDVEGDATIISASQNTNYVYQFDIKDGKWDGEVYEIICLNGANPGEEGVAFSYTPRLAFAEGGEAFYVDGFATYPELFDMDGNMLESFKGVFDEEGEVIRPSCLEKLYNDSAIAPSVGVCGCLEFKLGDITMFSMAAGSYEGAYEPYSSTKIFAFADENCHFDEIIPAWEVSKDGFGKVKNAQFNYVQQAVVVDENTTELYVYVSENGLAKYTITLNNPLGLKEVVADTQDGVKKVMINGQMYIIRNGVAYTAMGQIAE